METFWFAGYEYEVDSQALGQNNYVCYLWDTHKGWLRVELFRNGDKLEVFGRTEVKSRPKDSLVAIHAGPSTRQLRECEKTLSNDEAAMIRG